MESKLLWNRSTVWTNLDNSKKATAGTVTHTNINIFNYTRKRGINQWMMLSQSAGQN